MRNPTLTRVRATCRAFALLTLSVVIVVGLVACGSSKKATTAHSPTAKQPTSVTQFANRADQGCARQQKQEAALGPGLVNPDLVPRARLQKAGSYLGSIVGIAQPGIRAMTAAAKTPSERMVAAAFAKVVADYKLAAASAHHGDLAGFRAAFSRVAPHGNPNGPDMRGLQVAAKPIPFKVCGKGRGVL